MVPYYHILPVVIWYTPKRSVTEKARKLQLRLEFLNTKSFISSCLHEVNQTSCRCFVGWMIPLKKILRKIYMNIIILKTYMYIYIHVHGTPLQYSCLENPMDGGAWWAAVHGIARSRTRLSDFTLTFHFHALEEEMATHSSVLAWRIPWTEEPGGLQSVGSLGVGHDWATSLWLFTFMHWRRKWQPTPVFLPGESQGQRSLVGCCLWSCTESDTTEAT